MMVDTECDKYDKYDKRDKRDKHDKHYIHEKCDSLRPYRPTS